MDFLNAAAEPLGHSSAPLYVIAHKHRIRPAERLWVKRQNVCFSRRVDLSDKMCAFRGLEWAGPGVLCWGYERPAQPCRMAQEGLKSVSMPVS